MARTKRWLWIGVVLLAVVAVVRPMNARSSDDVDPSLVGKGKLEGAGQPIFWEINADGTYKVFGDGFPGHAGTFHAASGKWSLKSPTWGEDGGTYQLPNTDTFVGVGRMGLATWVRASNASTPSAAADRQMTQQESDDYINDYNAQWEKAAKGLRGLTTRAPRPSSGGDSTFGAYGSSDSGNNAEAEAAAQAEYQQRAAEGRAYWSGSAEDYNRIQNGECTSSDNARFGC